MGSSLLVAGVLMLTLYLFRRARKGSRRTNWAPRGSVYWNLRAATGWLGTAITGLLGFLAASAETSSTNDASENAAEGGVLNYRTGKLDDGRDPVGWYEQD